MKNIFWIVLLSLTATLATAQSATQIVSWDHTTIELGKIKKGEKREGSFSFTNISDMPVSIDIVDACECTTLDYSTEEIAPGDSSTISFVFDSSEKDASETIDVDVTFLNENPKTKGPYMMFLNYTFDLED